MKVVKIQHNTSLFHSKKNQSTSCLGACKACLHVFFGAIVKFHYFTLIWFHLLLCLLLLPCWAMVKSSLTFCIWKMFHLCPLCGFYTFFSKRCHQFLAFLTCPSCTSDHSRKIYLTIIDSKWFLCVRTIHYSMCLLGLMQPLNELGKNYWHFANIFSYNEICPLLQIWQLRVILSPYNNMTDVVVIDVSNNKDEIPIINQLRFHLIH
jgi:hypothetical protein